MILSLLEAHCNHLTAIPVTRNINRYADRIFTGYYFHTNWLDTDLKFVTDCVYTCTCVFYFRVGAGPTLAYQHSGADQGRQRVFFCFTPTSVTIIHARQYYTVPFSESVCIMCIYPCRTVFTPWYCCTLCQWPIKVTNCTIICPDLDLAVLMHRMNLMIKLWHLHTISVHFGFSPCDQILN